MTDKNYPRRLIEVDLPIKRISEHARREKSIRHGHISTLHIWWARRPLAACRAVLCAALWPDPVDELCPPAFKEAAFRIMKSYAREAMNTRTVRDVLLSKYSIGRLITVNQEDANFSLENPNALSVLRQLLLDFIADFANWDASNNQLFLKIARELTVSAHEALGGEPGTRPLVVDPFAGGGSIPLEALRVGADAFASDLNPMAVLLNKVVLEYIPKNGQKLADEVRKWGQWVKKEAEKELAEFYPKDPDGATPIAYLWARTIRCEGPGCGAIVPLIGTLWLSQKRGRTIALRMIPNHEQKRVDFQILLNAHAGDIQDGIVRRGSVQCPCCGYTTPVASVRRQLKARRGGSRDAQLCAVVTTHTSKRGRIYRLPDRRDLAIVDKAIAEYTRKTSLHSGPLSLSPEEPTPMGTGGGAGRAFSQRLYGMETFSDIYTCRQLLTLSTLARIISDEQSSRIPELIRILMALALGRVNDLSMTLCRWLPTIEAIASANGGQNRMPVLFDFVESNPFGGSGGNWVGQVDWVARVVEHLQASDLRVGSVGMSPAQKALLPSNSAEVFFTDPPYYDAFPYSDLSDFFLVWLKRALGPTILQYDHILSPKNEEIVVYDVIHGEDD
ncbi:DUF1156 domain-containing protein, partial [Chloroflexota bacterium]